MIIWKLKQPYTVTSKGNFTPKEVAARLPPRLVWIYTYIYLKFRTTRRQHFYRDKCLKISTFYCCSYSPNQHIHKNILYVLLKQFKGCIKISGSLAATKFGVELQVLFYCVGWISIFAPETDFHMKSHSIFINGLLTRNAVSWWCVCLSDNWNETSLWNFGQHTGFWYLSHMRKSL